MLATLSGDAHRDAARRRGDAWPTALTGGYHLAFLIGAALVLAAVAVAVFVLPPDEDTAAAEGVTLSQPAGERALTEAA